MPNRYCHLTLAACLAFLPLACCRYDSDLSRDLQIKQLQAFLQRPRAPVNGTEYRVLPPDVLMVRSRNVPEINDSKQIVRPDGKINLPLVGEVAVAGLTPREIEERIVTGARKYYDANVDAVVEVMEYKSQMYYVFGEVSKPGPQPWTGTDTVLDAMSKALPTTYSKPEVVRVLRGKDPKTGGFMPDCIPMDKCEANKMAKAAEARGLSKTGDQELVVDVLAMAQEGDLSHNVLLRPYDIVYVPPHPCVELGYGIQRVLFPLRALFEPILAPVYATNVVAGR